MKYVIFFFFIVESFICNSQENLQLLSEFHLANPIENASNASLNLDNGFGAGLHIDKLNIWGPLGLGGYAAYQKNDINFETNFPDLVSDPMFGAQLLEEGSSFQWSSVQLAIGPVLSLDLDKEDKVSFQVFSKIGLANVSYANYSYTAAYDDPALNDITLFETITAPEDEIGINLTWVSGAHLNYMFSKSVGISLGGNFSIIEGVTHRYRSLDATFEEGGEPNILYETAISSTTSNILQRCRIKNINGTVGIIVQLGGIPVNEPEEEEEILGEEQPENEEDAYVCEPLLYRAPGYNEPIILTKNPAVVFEWFDTNTRELKKDKQYQLQLFTKTGDSYTPVHTEILKGTTKSRVNMRNIPPPQDYAMYWQIVPASGNATICAQPRKMMKMLVFRNQAEADEKLPECLIGG